MARFLGFCLLGLAVVLAAGAPASAQGFGVYEQGACMMGRGGAGVADPCMDASGVFFNPAALSFSKVTITLGGALIGPTGTFTDTSGGALNGTVSTLNKKWYPVPNIYASVPFKQHFAFGIGVFAPYGLTTDWPSNSEGRFLGYKSLVQGIYVQPTLAIKFNDRVSVGVGADITYLNVELRQRVDLSSQTLVPGTTFAAFGVLPGTDFADVQLKGHAWNPGFHVGVQVKVNDSVSFGARFLSGQTVNVTNGSISTRQISAVKPDGTQYVLPVTIPGVAPAGTPLDLLVASQFATGGKLSNQTATTSLPLPAQFVAGLAFKVMPAVKLFTDVQFTNWDAFNVLPINGQYLQESITESYGNVAGLRVGTEISAWKKAAIRAGINVHGGAAPNQTVTPNLPEGSRYEFNAGFGYELTKRFRVDAAYMYLDQPERAGRTTSGANNGVFNFKANLFAASVSMIF
jgi:long-chain fatty acid transport protein